MLSSRSASLSPARKQFAFLIHPRNDVAGDMAHVHPLLGRIPNRWYEWLMARMPLRPWVQSRITAADSGELLGEVIVVPLTPKQLLGRDRVLTAKRIDAAIAYAHRRGAQLIGLGALTAPATTGGKKLAHLDHVGVTNGNAFTAAATVQAIQQVTRGMAKTPVIALVGATGSVGSAVTRGVAHHGIAAELILVGRSQARLRQLVAECGVQAARASVDMSDCVEADIIVLMTSATETLLRAEHVRQGAFVIDDTQPRNTTPALLVERPDITLIDGGLVLTPGLKRQGYQIGVPGDTSFACLAETALLALDGHEGHGVIGQPTLEQVLRLQSIADRNAHLGFHLAPPTSFGEPIDVAGWVL